MGEVYLAEDNRGAVSPRCAIGRRDLAEASDAEAHTAAALEHPNICTHNDVGEADGRNYIAMQYVEGERSASRMARQPFDVATASIASALAEAHRQGIIHRDLKPQNVTLTMANQAEGARLRFGEGHDALRRSGHGDAALRKGMARGPDGPVHVGLII